MILRGFFLVQIFWICLTNAESVTVSPNVTETPAVNLTIEVPSSIFEASSSSNITASSSGAIEGESTSSIEPSQTTAQSTPASSANKMSNKDQLDLSQKLLNNIYNKQSSSGDKTGSKGECDGLDWYTGCKANECNEQYLVKMNKLFKCKESKPENVSFTDLLEMVELVGMNIADDLVKKLKNGDPNNVSSIITQDKFVMGSGVIDGLYVNTTKDKYISFPNYSQPEAFVGSRWEAVRDGFSFSVEALKEKAAQYLPYSYQIYNDIIENRPLKMTEIETDYDEIIKDSDVSELFLEGNVLKTRRKPQNIYINTNMVSLKFKGQSFKNMENSVFITFKHKMVDKCELPSCVYWDTIHSIWSRKGCKVKETNATHTTCDCNHLTMFAVAMKEKNTENLVDRETLVTVAIVFGVISLILLVASAVCIFVVGYHFVDNMRIALNIDLALVLCHLFFFIGLSNSASKYVVTPSICDVISPFVHLFELAALSFLLMEGLHYMDRFKTIFSKRNTRKFYIYMSLGWGLPVAFAAACAGFAYPHYGSPIRNEFCWMSVYGSSAWYFGTPVLFLALLNLFVRGFVLKEVMGWKGNPDDLNIVRTRFRLVSSIVLLPVIMLTWLFGIIATNNSEQKAYHYFFIVFHTLQGILVFVFYCAKNQEMWDYNKNKKEKIKEERDAVYQFHYVP